MAILVTAIVAVYAVAQRFQPPPVPTAEVRFVSLDVIGAGWSIHYEPETTVNNTAFAILQEASVRLGFSLAYEWFDVPPGIFVTGINGSLNGAGARYWQYWVNGIYENVAADHRGLQDGDGVVWRFSIPQEGS